MSSTEPGGKISRRTPARVGARSVPTILFSPLDSVMPSREAACEEARTKTIQTLRSIRNDLVQEVKSGRPWPGMEFGKSHLGMAVTKALETLEEGYSEQAIPWKEIHNSIC